MAPISFDDLPVGIISHIFSFVSSISDLKNLAVCSHNINASSMPYLYESIEILRRPELAPSCGWVAACKHRAFKSLALRLLRRPDIARSVRNIIIDGCVSAIAPKM